MRTVPVMSSPGLPRFRPRRSVHACVVTSTLPPRSLPSPSQLLLGHILEVGNTLNEGTARAGAAGGRAEGQWGWYPEVACPAATFGDGMPVLRLQTSRVTLQPRKCRHQQFTR